MISKRELVGRFKSTKLRKEDLQVWVNKFWVPEVGYAPRINLLIKGCIIFIFPDEEKFLKILGRVWLLNESSLILKWWHISFNVAKERQTIRHLWMLLPRFPPELWMQNVLEELDNSVGRFIRVDKNSLYGLKKTMDRVMVELNIV